MALLVVVIAALAQAFGFAFCGVSLVYWTAAPISQYGILMFVFLWNGGRFLCSSRLLGVPKEELAYSLGC